MIGIMLASIVHSFRRPAWWHLFLLAALLWGGEYLRRDLWEPDEARYAYVAREMAQDGHWLVPFRSGEYYAHKPPLLFWLINGFSFVTGLPIGRLTVRLPGFFAGVLALWGTARLAERWVVERTAWPAVLTLCTTYLFWSEIGFARMDGPLLGWTMGALTLLVLNDDDPTLWRPALAWLCMGLGILTKGPVGLLVPAGAYVAMRLAAGEGIHLRKSHWIWGPLIALALPAIWLGLAWLHGAPDGYFRELLFSQNLERAAGVLGHRKSIFYFFPSVPPDLLPWTLGLPAAVFIAWRNPCRRLLLRRLAGWIGFVFVFFSLIASKRNIYVLGLVPAVAILIGSAWPDMNTARFHWARFARGTFLLLFLLAGPGLLLASFHPGIPVPAHVFWPTGLVATLGAILLWRELRRPAESPRFFLVAALCLMVAQATFGLFIYPAFNPIKTPDELAAAARKNVPPGRPLLIYRINGEILPYYANRPGEVARTHGDLLAAMRREGKGFAVFKKSDYEAWGWVALPLPGSSREYRMGSKTFTGVAFDYTRTPAVQTTPPASGTRNRPSPPPD